jgi:hypothetical protein
MQRALDRSAYKVSLENLKERKKLIGRLRCNLKDNIKTDPKELGQEVSTGFILLRIETGGGLL